MADAPRAYRQRVYPDYGIEARETDGRFDVVAAERWGRGYNWYLRGWLPTSSTAAIADVGCGGGNLLLFFRRRGFTNVCGVDVSRRQAALARQVTPDVLEQDLFDYLAGAAERFDLVTAFDVIEHLTRDEALAFLDLCFASLRPGGRLIVQTPNGETPWAGQLRYGDFTHEICFTPGSLSGVMRLAGFRDVAARELGPVPLGYSIASTVRWAVWRCLAMLMRSWNIVETGAVGSGVLTRVFIATGRKP